MGMIGPLVSRAAANIYNHPAPPMGARPRRARAVHSRQLFGEKRERNRGKLA